MTRIILVDELRQAPGIEQPSTVESRVLMERRRARRWLPKTLEDAHANVQAIAKRRVENDSRVKTWQFVERVVYLVALVGGYLLYYLIGKVNEALSLPSLF